MSTQDERWSAATRMLATHLLSLVGVAIASQRSLATYLAVSSLPRPIFPSTASSSTSEASSGSSRFRAFVKGPRVRKTSWVIGGILTGLAIWGLMVGTIVAMFRFASQVVLDTTFTLLLWAGFASCIYETLDITLSLPRTIAYKPLKPKATEKAEQSKWTLKKELVTEQSDVWYRQRRSVIGISVVTSAAIMLGVSMGFDFPLTFLPVVWIVPVVSNYTLPRMSIRRVSQVMLGYLMFMVLVAAVLIPVMIHFESKKVDKTPEEIAQDLKDAEDEAKKWTALSSWLDAIMSVFQYLYIIGGPGILVAMTWRFDYTSQHSAYLGTTESTNGESSALIPALGDLPSFEPRTAKYALGSLVACVVGLTGTHIIDRKLGEALSSTMGLVIVVPVMLAATSFGAWQQGVLREWWAYTETWVPSSVDEESSTSPLDDVMDENVQTKEKETLSK